MSVLVPLAVAAALAVGVDEKPGAPVPEDLRFVDAQGRAVTLGGALGDGAPVVLVLAYARCTLLCNVVLANLASAVRGLERDGGHEPGRDVRFVIVDLDDRVRPAEAAKKQAQLLAEAGLPGEPARWPYLLGEGDSVARLAAALGFRYAWDPRTQQYVHPAVVFVLTPDHRISRYLYGIELAPRTLATAVDDAAEGRVIGSAAEAVLRCFQFDPAASARRARIQRAMQAGATVIFLALAATLVTLALRERRRRS